MKILIVDDSKAMRLLVKRILRQVGVDTDDTIEAADGQEGVEQVMAHQPELVISDWNMPNKNGIEFLREIRAKQYTGKFGFVTTETSREMREIAINAGAQFMIGKPFTPESFQSTIVPVIEA
ncbi:MAG: response regulator [Gammaproteobacteria bacterium]|nr:response regulator [Gammaproteobacteria bacterium]